MKKGVFYILLSSIFFVFTDVFAKLCHLPEVEKNFFMTLLATFLAIGLIVTTKKKIIINDKKTAILLVIRSLFGLTASVMYLFALSNIALVDATLLMRTAPFFVIIFSMILFRERINKRLLCALIIAIIGTIFVLKPSMNYTLGSTIIGLLSGVFSGAAYVSIRCLKDYTNPETIALSFGVISIVVSIPIMLLSKFVVPNLTDIVYLIGMGVSVAIAQYALSIAYSIAEPSKISIYTYSEVIISALFGLIIWREYLGVATIFGGLLIISSGIINYNNKESIPYDV